MVDDSLTTIAAIVAAAERTGSHSAVFRLADIHALRRQLAARDATVARLRDALALCDRQLDDWLFTHPDGVAQEDITAHELARIALTATGAFEPDAVYRSERSHASGSKSEEE